ncbi:hypothetical protein [Streptomyces canarius]
MREAIDLAIDRPALAEIAMEGLGSPANQLVTRHHPGAGGGDPAFDEERPCGVEDLFPGRGAGLGRRRVPGRPWRGCVVVIPPSCHPDGGHPTVAGARVPAAPSAVTRMPR